MYEERLIRPFAEISYLAQVRRLRTYAKKVLQLYDINVLPTMRVKAVYVSGQSVDFRKSHDGLLAECYRLGTDPFAGDMVVFIGRNRRRIKILFADATGLWLASKRFTDYAMKTSFKFLSDPTVTATTNRFRQKFAKKV